MRRSSRLLPFLAAALCLAPLGLRAQSYVRPPCASEDAPAFENDLHARWYKRFWTGECQGLPLRCIGGKPYWNQMVQGLVGRASADRREAVAALACRLGREIGLEWSRPNAVRRIDTGDLKAWSGLLQRPGDVYAVLATVDSQVKAKIAPRA